MFDVGNAIKSVPEHVCDDESVGLDEEGDKINDMRNAELHVFEFGHNAMTGVCI
jgi:hypothetical protein